MTDTLDELLKLAGDSPILVSACLLGMATRYDASSRTCDVLSELARRKRFIPVCPEQLGGLPTPRVRATLTGGDGEAVLEGRAKVANEAGRDLTENFLRGARETIDLARLLGARFAILKEKSPSCGVRKTYVDAKLADGCGVTTAALKMAGIDVFVID